MNLSKFLTLVALLQTVFLPAAVIGAGPYGRGGGWNPDSAYCRLYDPAKTLTLNGTITAIDHFTPMRGMSRGIHLMLKTDKEEISIHLGPSWYLDNQDMTLQVGDKIEVTGSRITFDGKPALIASQVKRGDRMLQLRDSKGIPLWSGWRHCR